MWGGGRVKPEWFKGHMPAPFLTAKPNLFLLLEPSSLPLPETESPLLLRFVLFGLRADFSISCRYRLISTPAPHSPYTADSLPDSNYALLCPSRGFAFYPQIPNTPLSIYFLLPLSFLKLLIFFLRFPHKSWGFSF